MSNADPEWMRSVQQQYHLGGTLDTDSDYAGNAGETIDGVEIRAYKGQTNDHPVGDLPGAEYTPLTRYMVDQLLSWRLFTHSALNDHMDGIKINTSTAKPYYLSYKTWNAGNGDYYPEVKSTDNGIADYAGYPGQPIQLLNINVYRNDGVKIKTGVVVMYRVHVDNRWLPWVSNANPDWMRKVYGKYALDGKLDTESTYAGNKGQNINGVEIRIFEENDTVQEPVGKYKIIENVPFECQKPAFPTGCESVSTVMALNYAGVKISSGEFVDTYLDKKLSGVPFDPNVSFGGNPRKQGGSYGCYAPVIKKALDKILTDKSHIAKVLNGKSVASLCSEYIDKDIPVIFWATTDMDTPYYGNRWSYNGRDIQWISPMHCLVLVGYDEKHYIFNDPLKDGPQTYYRKDVVEKAYAGLFKQAIVILDTVKELERVDRSVLMNTYHYTVNYNNRFNGDGRFVKLDMNDYNFLACLQLLYIFYWDKEDYEKTDVLFSEMLRLRKLHPAYKLIYADFLDSNGEFVLGYKYYAPGRKTMELEIDRAVYFSKETIRKIHQEESWLVFFSSIIPGLGVVFGPLMAAALEREQSGNVSISKEIIKNGAITAGEELFWAVIETLGIPGYAVYAISTIYNLAVTAYDTAGEERETYIQNGVVLQDGDSFFQVTLEYDLGIELHTFMLYFRNGYPYVTDLEQYNRRWDTDPRGEGVAKQVAKEYQDRRFVPSEKHSPRGKYWPL